MSAAPPPAAPADPPAGGPDHPAGARPSRAWWLLVIAALAGGGIAWRLLEARENPFSPSKEMQALTAKQMAMIPLSDDENARLAWFQADLDRNNAAAAFAMIGLPVAALAGLAAGLAGRSWVAAVVGLLGGAVAGALLGGAGGWLAAAVYRQLRIGFALNAGYAATASHAVIWTLLALAVALAVWPGARRDGAGLARVAAAAVVGALIAAALYPVVAGLAFTMSNSDLIVPAGRWNRLAWIELAAFAITVAVVRAMLPRSRRAAAARAVA